MTVLITAPNYDTATAYLYAYAKDLRKFCKEGNKEVLWLERPRLTKENFSQLIEKKKPKLVFLNAHGDDKTIYGDKKDGVVDYIVRVGENERLLDRKITYAQACWASLSLGKKCAENEGVFIGYEFPFSFWWNANYVANPKKDKTAKLFLEPSVELSKSLVKGKTAKEAVDKFKDLSIKNILKLLKKKKEEPGTMTWVRGLWSNMDGLTIDGDELATYS